MNDKGGPADNTQILLPGGVPSALPSPGSYIVRGLGGRCWDQNGKVFIDFVCGYGPLVLGHCNAEVNQAVIEQMERGMMFPSNSPLHDELTSVLKRIFPYTDRSLFLKSGSEAVSAAIRLARAFTGKTKIIRCGFHGWHDSVVSPHVSWHLYEPDPQPPRLVAGVPQASLEPLVLPWYGEDLQQLEDLFREHRSTVAALLLDPVQLREPLEDCIRELRRLTRDEGALLILDEIKTGFRVSLAGVQGLYNVQPDLTILSKAISNGFPLSAVVGRAEILNLSASAKIMGTYNNELVSIAAALKTISILERPTSIPWLWQIGQKLINGINEIMNRLELIDDIQAIPYRWPCMPYILFRSRSERAQRLKPAFHQQLVQRGVLSLANHMNFICLAHTTDDVEDALQIVEDALVDCLSGRVNKRDPMYRTWTFLH